MDFGLNYNDAGSTNNFVRYFRAVTDSMRDLDMGSVYWPAIGGKISEYGYDRYSMFVLEGGGTNLTLSIRNSTGADRLRHGWGDGADDTGTVTLTARHPEAEDCRRDRSGHRGYGDQCDRGPRPHSARST